MFRSAGSDVFALRDPEISKETNIFYRGIVFLTMAGLSALFIGELFVYKDEPITRKWDTSAFLKEKRQKAVGAPVGWLRAYREGSQTD